MGFRLVRISMTSNDLERPWHNTLRYIAYCAVFLTTEPDPWPTVWCKSILHRVLWLFAAHARQRRKDRRKSNLNSGAYYATLAKNEGRKIDGIQVRKMNEGAPKIWILYATHVAASAPLLLLICVSWTIIGQPGNSVFIRLQLCQRTGLDNVGHRLSLAARTRISVCKSLFFLLQALQCPCSEGDQNPVAGLWGHTLGRNW